MRYTTEDGGRLNNFAIEPKMYTAEPPTGSQKRTYLILGTLGAVIVGALVFIASTVSS
ncbi:MAG TPA: ssl1498 family light-harvesting-like protein [Microcoleaceae cyanobacterium]|jgi:hypothetical protein